MFSSKFEFLCLIFKPQRRIYFTLVKRKDQTIYITKFSQICLFFKMKKIGFTSLAYSLVDPGCLSLTLILIFVHPG
jgi:hypothetical protein